MRLIRNLTISWETNFFDKNTCLDKVFTKRMIKPIRTLLDTFLGPKCHE
jgi:hypothetical protein